MSKQNTCLRNGSIFIGDEVTSVRATLETERPRVICRRICTTAPCLIHMNTSKSSRQEGWLAASAKVDREFDRSVRHYLQQMANVPMLTKDEESAAFREVEASRKTCQAIFNRFRFAKALYARLLDRIEGHEARFDSIVSGDYPGGRAAYVARIPELRRKLKHARSGVAVDRCADEIFLTQRCFESLCAEAEAPVFRTKMEIKDNSGEHFRRLLASFSNPSGVEMLQARMSAAAERNFSSTSATSGALAIRETISAVRTASTAPHEPRKYVILAP